MSFRRRLIVNADDFGLHPDINEAIGRSHIEGIVTSASLMSYPEGAAGFADAVSRLRDLPYLHVGLHLALAGARGLPGSYASFMQAKLSGAFPSSRIESLIRRQLDALLSRDVRVRHIDSHQHLHALPSVARVIARTVRDYGVTTVRLPIERGGFGNASMQRIGAAKVLGLLALRSKREYDRHGLRYPDHFRGMAISGQLTPHVLRRFIHELPPGVTEILCHPGSNNERLREAYDWGYNWEGELRSILDPRVSRSLRISRVELTDFRSLL